MTSYRLNQLVLCLLLVTGLPDIACNGIPCQVPPLTQRSHHQIKGDFSLEPCSGTYQLSTYFGAPRPLASTPRYDAFGILLQLPSGRLLSIYRRAETHRSDRGVIVERTSDDEGAHWSASRVIFEHPSLDTRDVSGGVLPSGTIVLFLNTYDFRKDDASKSRVFYSRSTDGGETWSKAILDPGVEANYGPLVITPDRIAMCVSVEDPYEVHSRVYLDFSFDDGVTWTCRRRIANSDFPYIPTGEDAFVWLGGDKILGFGRNRPGKPLLRFYSSDMGSHWDIRQTDLGADATANLRWHVISPWIVKPSPELPQVQVLWCERIQLSSTFQRGDLHSLLIDSAQAISAPNTLRNNNIVFAAPTFDFGYPSVAMTGNGRFLTQFYVRTSDPPDLYLLPGTYTDQCGK